MSESEQEIKVNDKRHWATEEAVEGGEPDLERLPTYVEQIQKQAEQSDAKLKEYINAYKDKMAENDRFRQRLSKDVERRAEAMLVDFLRTALPVMDNLNLAIESAENGGDFNKLVEGVGMIRSGLSSALAGCGMEEVECLGENFDPEIAEAVEIVEVKEKEKDGKTLKIVQAGYRINDRLLRPAKVGVGKLVENS